MENTANQNVHTYHGQITFEQLFFLSLDAHFLVLAGKFVACNPSFIQMVGASDMRQVLQLRPSDISPEYQPDGQSSVLKADAFIEQALREGSVQFEWVHQRLDGELFPVDVTLNTLTFDTDTLIYGNWRDIRERKRMQEEQAQVHQQIIEAQRSALREISTPLIPLADRVIAMPLVGTIDTTRAKQVMETLLDGVTQYVAKVAILDITGVAVVDTQVAQALVQTARAVRLLGAQVILTGIGPTMAQTLVHLGADLSSIVTFSSLQDGIAYALRSRTHTSHGNFL
jgi:PAS domain S-box-containing protein